MVDIDPIGLAKAILWEEAKGKLRALAAASGQNPSNKERSPSWVTVNEAVEKFIHDFEDEGYHELAAVAYLKGLDYSAVPKTREAVGAILDTLLLKNEEIKRLTNLLERENEGRRQNHEWAMREVHLADAAEARATSAWNDAIKEAGKVAKEMQEYYQEEMDGPWSGGGYRASEDIGEQIRSLSRPVEANPGSPSPAGEGERLREGLEEICRRFELEDNVIAAIRALTDHP